MKANKLKTLATLLPQRSPLLPVVPTLAELGIPLGDLPTWNAVFAPANTPREAVDKLSDTIVQAVKSPAVRTALVQQGTEPLGSTARQLADAVEAATSAWNSFVRDYEIPRE